MNINKINTVLNLINFYTARHGKILTISDIDKPLTGIDINLSGAKLYELYLILSENIGYEIKLNSYYDFYTIRSIASIL